MASTNLKAHELQKFLTIGNLLYRQFQMDSLESNENMPFQPVEISPEGEFDNAANKVDIAVLKQMLKWISDKLNLKENELYLVENRGDYSIDINTNIKDRVLKFLDNHLDNSNNIEVGPDLTKEAFYTKDTHEKSNLSPKGLTLVQNYYSAKDKLRNDTFICADTDLPGIFDKLAQAKDGVTFNIIFRAGGAHWVPLQCQKRDGKFFLIEMDSLGTKKDFTLKPHELSLPKFVMKSNLLKNQDVTILRAANQRQTAPNNCAYFSLKDARKMQNNPNLLETVMKHQTRSENDKVVSGKVKLAYYITPVEHMNTVQSRGAVTNYVKQHNELIKDNPITEEEVLDMSFNKVKKPIKSRVELTGKDKQSKVVLMVKDKYMSGIVDTKIEKTPISSLSKIVDTYNAKNLTVDRMNKTVEEPRNLAKITPDPEEVILVEAKPLPEAKIKVEKAKEEVVDDPMPSIPKVSSVRVKPIVFEDKPTIQPVQRQNARANLTKTQSTVALSGEASDNQKVLMELNEKLNAISLASNAGYFTNNALANLKSAASKPANNPKQIQDILTQLKGAASKINEQNLKSEELKKVIKEINQINVASLTRTVSRVPLRTVDPNMVKRSESVINQPTKSVVIPPKGKENTANIKPEPVVQAKGKEPMPETKPETKPQSEPETIVKHHIKLELPPLVVTTSKEEEEINISFPIPPEPPIFPNELKKSETSSLDNSEKRKKAMVMSTQEKDVPKQGMTNDETLKLLREAINKVELDNTVGQITKGTLAKLKACEKSSNKDVMVNLRNLKEVAAGIAMGNIKSPELKNVINQINEARVIEPPKRTFTRRGLT